MASIRSDQLAPYGAVEEGHIEHEGTYTSNGGDPTAISGNPLGGGYDTGGTSEKHEFQTESNPHEEVSGVREGMHLHEDQVADNPFTPLPKDGEGDHPDESFQETSAPNISAVKPSEPEEGPRPPSRQPTRASDSGRDSRKTTRQRLKRATDSVREGVRQASAHVAYAGEQVGWVWNKTLDRAMWVCAVSGILAIALLGMAASLRTWRIQELSYEDVNGANTSRVELGLEKLQRIQTLDRVNDAGFVYMYDPPLLYQDAMDSAYCNPDGAPTQGGMEDVLALSEGLPETSGTTSALGPGATPTADGGLPEPTPVMEGGSAPDASLEGSEASPVQASNGDTGSGGAPSDGESPAPAGAPADAAPREPTAATETAAPNESEPGAAAAGGRPASAAGAEGVPTAKPPRSADTDAQRTADTESPASQQEDRGTRETTDQPTQIPDWGPQANFLGRRLQQANPTVSRRQGPLAEPPPYNVTFGRNPGTPGSLDKKYVEMREVLLGSTLFDIHCKDLKKFKKSGSLFIRLSTAYLVFAGIGLLAAVVAIGLGPLTQPWAVRLKAVPLNLVGTVAWLVALVLQLFAIATWGLGTDVAACVTQEGGAAVCRLGPATVLAITSLVFTLIAAITYTIYFAHRFIKDLGLEKKELEIKEAAERRQLEESQAANYDSARLSSEGPTNDLHRGLLVPPQGVPRTGPHPQALGESNTPVRSITDEPSMYKHEKRHLSTEPPAPEEGRRPGSESANPNEIRRSGAGSPVQNESRRSGAGTPIPIPLNSYA